MKKIILLLMAMFIISCSSVDVDNESQSTSTNTDIDIKSDENKEKIKENIEIIDLTLQVESHVQTFEKPIAAIKVYEYSASDSPKKALIIEEKDVISLTHEWGTKNTYFIPVGVDKKLNSKSKYYVTLELFDNNKKINTGISGNDTLGSVFSNGYKNQITFTIK